jgi:hypothetical protein
VACTFLDTRKYALDCNNTFGYFVHHYPYFGERSEIDKEDLANSFEATQFLTSAHFGNFEVSRSSKCNAVCGDGYIEASKCNAVCGDGYIEASQSECSICRTDCVGGDSIKILARPRPTR